MNIYFSNCSIMKRLGKCIWGWVLLGLLSFTQLAISADKRVALVIGNQAYQAEAKLNNPRNDAIEVTRMLRDTMNFEIIEVDTDLDWDSFDQGLDKFYRTLKGADIGLFYFSGHGMRDEKGSGNYLLPVDARISKDSHIRKHGFRVGDILEGMNLSGVKTSLLFLDACRDNPFGTGSKGGKRGLIKLDKPPPHSLIAFAAEYGHTADDGDGNHGPYTEALLKHLPTKNAPLLELMGRVREEVFEITGQAQSPIEENRLTKPVYLAGQDLNSNDINNTSSISTNTNTPAENIFWQSIANSRLCGDYQAYLSAYPHGNYVGLANVRIAVYCESDSVEQQSITSSEESRKPFEPEMVHIRGGSFIMGSPVDEEGRDNDERQHKVTVNDFFIGKYEVTVQEFRRFVEATDYITDAEKSTDGNSGCWAYAKDEEKQSNWHRWASWKRPNKHIDNRDNDPVRCVSFHDVMAYIDWLNEESNQQYRLPTESEWEYASRGGTTTARFWGDDLTEACHYANVKDKTVHEGNSWNNPFNCTDNYYFISPVGSFASNPFDLHDILGNVWEWTCSLYDMDYNGSENECAPQQNGDSRVIRDGSYTGSPASLRSANRGAYYLFSRTHYVGFRLARTN